MSPDSALFFWGNGRQEFGRDEREGQPGGNVDLQSRGDLGVPSFEGTKVVLVAIDVPDSAPEQT